MDTPAGGYRSAATLEGVRDYLGKLGVVYNLRGHKAARFGELVVK